MRKSQKFLCAQESPKTYESCFVYWNCHILSVHTLVPFTFQPKSRNDTTFRTSHNVDIKQSNSPFVLTVASYSARFRQSRSYNSESDFVVSQLTDIPTFNSLQSSSFAGRYSSICHRRHRCAAAAAAAAMLVRHRRNYSFLNITDIH